MIGRIRIVAIFLNTTTMDSNKKLLAITINVFTESKFTVMTLDIRICKHFTKTRQGSYFMCNLDLFMINIPNKRR